VSAAKKTSRRRRAPGQPDPAEAVMIVDLQQAFVVPARVVERIERYARRFNRRVFTRFINPEGSLFRTRLHQRSCAPGTPDTKLLIEPARDDLVLTKQGYGLTAAHIRALRRRGIKKVTVCGIDTDACVLGVMFSLFDAGIECRAKADLCWSSNGLQSAAIKIIKAQFPRPK
jgi:nicotinamidase-related amidase